MPFAPGLWHLSQTRKPEGRGTSTAASNKFSLMLETNWQGLLYNIIVFYYDFSVNPNLPKSSKVLRVVLEGFGGFRLVVHLKYWRILEDSGWKQFLNFTSWRIWEDWGSGHLCTGAFSFEYKILEDLGGLTMVPSGMASGVRVKEKNYYNEKELLEI